MLRAAVFLLLWSPAWSGTLTEEMFHGRHAWVLSNGLIRVSLLRGGGDIAEVRLISNDSLKSVNPMRIPHYQTIEPYEFNPAKHEARFGNHTHKLLSAGYMGHLLCFPIYGPPSPDEAKTGLNNHGEADVVEWHKIKSEVTREGVTLWYGADLLKTQYRVERKVHLADGERSVHVEEQIENPDNLDRPFNLMEHATFGPPFAAPGKTVLDMSATRGQVGKDPEGTSSLKAGSPVQWPAGTAADGKRVDLRVFQAKEKSGAYYTMRLDPARNEQFFALFNPDYRVLIGYLFPSEGNPWIADWQENHRTPVIPWNGQVVARGIEFGTSPFDEGLHASVDRGSLFGAPTFRWIGARQKIRSEFTIVLAEVPEGFAGVKDLRVEKGNAVIVPRR